MRLLIFFQCIFDLAALGGVIWFYLNKRALRADPTSDQAQFIEQWKKDWELEKQNHAQQLAVQLRSIRLLHDQTKKLIDEKASGGFNFPISQEENELKHLGIKKEEPIIPTLIEFETQKDLLKQESTLDLKSLLTEQLY